MDTWKQALMRFLINDHSWIEAEYDEEDYSVVWVTINQRDIETLRREFNLAAFDEDDLIGNHIVTLHSNGVVHVETLSYLDAQKLWDARS